MSKLAQKQTRKTSTPCNMANQYLEQLSLKIANDDGRAKQKHTRGQKISESKKAEQSRAWSKLLRDTELCDHSRQAGQQSRAQSLPCKTDWGRSLALVL